MHMWQTGVHTHKNTETQQIYVNKHILDFLFTGTVALL